MTREDMLRDIAAGTVAIVVCRRRPRRATLHRPPGAKAGYFCVFCQAELEATLVGQGRIARGAWPMCQPCSIPIADALPKAPP